MTRGAGDQHDGTSTPRLAAAVLASSEVESRRIARVLDTSGDIEILPRARTAAELESSGEAPDAVVISCVVASTGIKRRIVDLKRRLPSVPVVAVVLDKDSSRAVREALEANAEGVVLADRIEEALVPAVRAVSAEQIVLPRSEYRHTKPVVLSHREREVLQLAVGGMTNDSIAKALYISRSTVKSHLTSAFAKLSVRSRSEAAAVLSNPDEPATRLVFSGQAANAAAFADSAMAGGSV